MWATWKKRTGGKSNCTQYFFHDFYGSHGTQCAVMIRVGNQKGLGAFVDLRRIAKSVFLLTLLIDIVFAVIFIFAKDAFPWLYLESSTAADVVEVATIASSLFLVAAFFKFLMALKSLPLSTSRVARRDCSHLDLLYFLRFGWVYIDGVLGPIYAFRCFWCMD